MARQTGHEKYREALKDLALGADAPGNARERDLLAHAAECEACREEYAHARRVRQFLDSGVARLVSAELSPQFDARLRARLAQEAVRGGASRGIAWPRLGWRWTAAGGLAFAVAALLLALIARDWRPGGRPARLRNSQSAVANPPGRLSASNRGPGIRSSQTAEHNPGVTHRQTPVASHDSRHSRRSSPAHSAYQASRRSARRRAEPEVLVPPGQLEALERYAAAIEQGIKDGTIDPKKFAAEQAQLEAEASKPIEIKPIEIPPIEIKPIEIKPIEIATLDVGPDDSAGAAPRDSLPSGAPLRSGLHWIGLAP